MRTLTLIAAALLAACSDDAARNQTDDRAAASDQAALPSAPGERGSLVEESRPSAKDPADPRSPQAARQVLKRYFAMVEAGRHDHAAELWWDSERADAFAAELRRFGDFRPSIAAPGRVEGAAGSTYVDISIQLLGDTESGIEALSDGTAVLRRSNDVPGSTAEQREWRIDRIALQPPPVATARRSGDDRLDHQILTLSPGARYSFDVSAGV